MELTAISSQAISKKLKSIELPWQGKKRTADIYVPPNLPESSPMVLMLHVHHSRVADLVVPDLLTTEPSLPVRA